MEPTGQHLAADIAQQAMQTFHRNADTVVAGYLIRHPDVDPADVELVMRVEGGTMTFRVEPKELHVPTAMQLSPREHFSDVREFEDHKLEVSTWNACRAEMLKLAKAVKAQAGTMVTLLSEVIANG